MEKVPSVIVIGVDGLALRRTERMMDEGNLPNFARLRKKGTFGALSTSNPAQSPVAWTSIATGSNPAVHGLFDFIKPGRPDYIARLTILQEDNKWPSLSVTPRYLHVRAASAFWDETSSSGIPTTVLRWPVTFPPEKVSGHFLSGLGAPEVTGSLGRSTLNTTDIVDSGAADAQNVRSIAFKDSRARTVFSGPRVQGVSGISVATVDMEIELLSADCIAVRIGKGKPYVLRKGSWSDYVPVSFPLGVLRRVPAMVRFFLVCRQQI